MALRAETLIFDIDGTLVDSNDLHAQAWQEAFRKFGVDLPYATIREQMGKGGDLLVPDLLTIWQLRRFGKELGDHRRTLFRSDYLSKVKPFPGIRETIAALHDDGRVILLASSSDAEEVDYYVDLLGIVDWIEGATSKGDAKHSKPSPEIFQAALDKAPGDARRAVAIGDTPYDVTAAHRATLPTVAVRSGGFSDAQLAEAELLVDDVCQIPSRLESIDAWFVREHASEES